MVHFEIGIFYAIILIISYVFVALAIPTALNSMLWRVYVGNFSDLANIVTMILFNVIFFYGISRITGYKVTIYGNISIVNIFLAFGCSIIFFILLDNLLDPIFDRLFPVSAIEYQALLVNLRLSPVTTFIRVCLFAPITEELLIRGYIFNGLYNKYGAVTTLIITTVIFALLHFNFVQTLSAVICGLVIGFLYLKTKSVFCCILSHALYNGISYFIHIIDY